MNNVCVKYKYVITYPGFHVAADGVVHVMYKLVDVAHVFESDSEERVFVRADFKMS